MTIEADPDEPTGPDIEIPPSEDELARPAIAAVASDYLGHPVEEVRAALLSALTDHGLTLAEADVDHAAEQISAGTVEVEGLDDAR